MTLYDSVIENERKLIDNAAKEASSKSGLLTRGKINLFAPVARNIFVGNSEKLFRAVQEAGGNIAESDLEKLAEDFSKVKVLGQEIQIENPQIRLSQKEWMRKKAEFYALILRSGETDYASAIKSNFPSVESYRKAITPILDAEASLYSLLKSEMRGQEKLLQTIAESLTSAREKEISEIYKI